MCSTMAMPQVNTSPQGGRSFGAGRGFHPPRSGYSTGFGDSYGSSGFGSWKDDAGTRSGDEDAGFRRGRVADDDWAGNPEDCFQRGFRTEHDWNTSDGTGGFPRGFRNGSGWTDEGSGGAPRRKSCVRHCCDRDGEDCRGWGRRSAVGFPRGCGFARQGGHTCEGPAQVAGGVQKRPKTSSGYVIKKGDKMVPRDANYDFLRTYIHRIDKTVKRGRNKGIMATSSNGGDAKLMNDFVYFLAQADQELRIRLQAARRTGQGECNCCGRNNSKVLNSNANANVNASIEDDDEEW